MRPCNLGLRDLEAASGRSHTSRSSSLRSHSFGQRGPGPWNRLREAEWIDVAGSGVFQQRDGWTHQRGVNGGVEIAVGLKVLDLYHVLLPNSWVTLGGYLDRDNASLGSTPGSAGCDLRHCGASPGAPCPVLRAVGLGSGRGQASGNECPAQSADESHGL